MTKINIHNVRLGHATNSSSSHSIVIIPKGTNLRDDGYICYDDDDYYGWDNFTLSNPESKKQYLVSQFANSLEESVGPHKASELIKEWFDVDFAIGKGGWNDSEILKSPNIDHQSVLTFPMLTESYAKDLVEGLSNNDQVVIFGGNDNSEPMEQPEGSRPLAEIEQFREVSSRYKCRTRKDGKYYIMYSPDSGNKIRLSFDQVHLDNPAEGYEKSYTPELVDVKITNKCSYGCDFCLTPDTLISTLEGVKPIKDIKVGEFVIVFDENKKELTHISIAEIYEREYDDDIIEIETENGKVINITPKHDVYTQNRGWILAEELSLNDILLHI